MSSPGTEPDHYQTLGVSRDASQEEIRRAYKKAAVRWHPDKNAGDKERAEVMFKQIGEAYSVLSDAERRAEYDNPNVPGEYSFSFGGLDSAFSVFDDFFRGSDPFSGFDGMFDAAFEGFGNSDGMFNTDFFKEGASSSMPPVSVNVLTTGTTSTPPRAASARNQGGAPSASASGSPATSTSTKTSTKTTTKVVDGKRVVTTETTVGTPDGKSKTTKRKTMSPDPGRQSPSSGSGVKRDSSGPSPAKNRSPASGILAVAGAV